MSQVAQKERTDALDLTKLGRYLAGHIPAFGQLQRAKKFAGGQSNPTFLLESDSGSYVLRRQPPGKLLASAHAVDREFRVIQALAQSDVPVPDVYHLCEDRDVIGSMFYVMSFEQGRIEWNAALPGYSSSDRTAIYQDMNRVLAALHEVDIAAVGLSDFGRPGNYFSRQISRWSKQYQASETDTIAEMDQLMSWLPQIVPDDDGQISLIHGDFRLDNMMLHPDKPQIIALLDWELSTLGHPYADLAYQCMQWRLSSDDLVPGLAGLDRKALGIPTEQEYIGQYCQRRGLTDIPDWNFYLAFSFFRLAAILQGVRKRALDGNASSKQAHAFGAMAPRLAQMGAGLL